MSPCPRALRRNGQEVTPTRGRWEDSERTAAEPKVQQPPALPAAHGQQAASPPQESPAAQAWQHPRGGGVHTTDWIYHPAERPPCPTLPPPAAVAWGPRDVQRCTASPAQGHQVVCPVVCPFTGARNDPPALIRTATATPKNPERQRCAEGKRLHHRPPRLPSPKPLACGAPWRLVIILPRFLWESDPLFAPISQTRAEQANPKICLVGFLPNILKKDPASISIIHPFKSVTREESHV